MFYDFDRVIDRRGTDSYKWDYNYQKFGRNDIIPLWVSDMDFPCSEEIVEAFRERIDHRIFGYSIRGDRYYHSIVEWFQTRHDWDIDMESICFCPPGVIMGVNILIDLLTVEGDKILTSFPAYSPLFKAIVDNKRILLENPLKFIDGQYEFDFELMEEQIDEKTKAIILCSPHNPTGRVWKRDELERLLAICEKHDLYVISDEIHCDIVYEGSTHIPFSSLSDAAAERSITCMSTNKTFNLGGLQHAVLVIKNKSLRERYNRVMDTYQLRLDNVFSAVALEAGYSESGAWLDQVLSYIQGNLDYARSFIEQNLAPITYVEPQGTYFLWIDFRRLGLTNLELRDLLVNEARIGLMDGLEFGESGLGFARLNLACSRVLLVQAFNQLKGVMESKNESVY